MKIKTVKKMNLPELIQYVWDNGIGGTRFFSDKKLPDGSRLRLHVNHRDDLEEKCAGISLESGHFVINDSYIFTVEDEEELTEDTEIHGATLVYYNELRREIMPFRYADESSPMLKHIIQPRSGTVALAVFIGKQLIWTKEHGIPESGVLEVGAE